jgi:hypothetical protein
MCAVDMSPMCPLCVTDHISHRYHPVHRAAAACRAHLSALARHTGELPLPKLTFAAAAASSVNATVSSSALPSDVRSPAEARLLKELEHLAADTEKVHERASIAEAAARNEYERALAGIRVSCADAIADLEHRKRDVELRLSQAQHAISDALSAIEVLQDGDVVLRYAELLRGFMAAYAPGSTFEPVDSATMFDAPLVAMSPLPSRTRAWQPDSSLSPLLREHRAPTPSSLQAPVRPQSLPQHLDTLSPARHLRPSRTGLTMDDFTVEGVPAGGCVLVRSVVAFSLRIKDATRSRLASAGALDEVLSKLLSCTSAYASATNPGPSALLQRVHVSVHADAAVAALVLSMTVPEDICGGGSLTVHGAVVDGRAVPGLPVTVHVVRPVRSPSELQAPTHSRGSVSTLTHCQLCVTADGIVYVPAGAAIFAFNDDGASRPDLDLMLHGVTRADCTAFDDSTGALVVMSPASDAALTDAIICLIPSSGSCVWRRVLPWRAGEARPPSALSSYRSAVVFSPHGGSSSDVPHLLACASGRLEVFRVSDGQHVQSISGLYCSLAVDPLSAQLWACQPSNGYCVGSLSVSVGVHRTVLRYDKGVAAAAGTAEAPRPMTVVPAAAGKQTSHLVISVVGTPTLQVLALPRFNLIHHHTISWTNVRVCGLAADLAGRALLFVDSCSGSVGVLPWPLPGMPVLL